MTDWTSVKTSARAILANQQGLAISATWGQTTFSAIRTTLKRQDVNTDDGLISGHYNFSILVDRSSLASIPSRRDKISIGGTSYRVLAAESDALDAVIRIDLGDVLQ